QSQFLNQDTSCSGHPDITWHGIKAWNPDFSNHSRTIAFMLCGKKDGESKNKDDYIYIAMNMHWETHCFEIPNLHKSVQWHIFANTGVKFPEDIWEPGNEPLLDNQQEILVASRSLIILVGR
ncbi:MAG: glycogen debranching enzyme, partial [Cyanobacteria bacterium J06636_27]